MPKNNSDYQLKKKENRISPNQSADFAYYSNIETMGAVDGPGIRLIIFLQGCPLNCLFCHNPETIPFSVQDKKITIPEIINLYQRNESFYKNGGITISGGEPMAQIEFLIALFKEMKKIGAHTCVDTAATPVGVYDVAKIRELMAVTDLFIIDIKHPDQERSIALTGQGVEHQKGLIKLCEETGNKYWVRHVFLPTWSDAKDEYMVNLGKMIGNLSNMLRFEFLPYHVLGLSKYENLGWIYPLGNIEPPTKESIKHAKDLLKEGMDVVRKNPLQGLITQKPYHGDEHHVGEAPWEHR